MVRRGISRGVNDRWPALSLRPHRPLDQVKNPAAPAVRRRSDRGLGRQTRAFAKRLA